VHRPVASILLVALAAGCREPVAPPVDPPAYDPTQLSGVLYHWPTGRTIAVYTDTTGVPSGTGLAATVSAAMAAWQATVQPTEAGPAFAFRVATSPADADVIVHTSAAPRLVGLAGCAAPPAFASGSTIFCPATDTALTLPLLSGTVGRVKVDITVNLAVASALNPLAALVTHELGHAIGIGGHSPDAGDVMYAFPTVSSPSSRDITTIRWVVRQRMELRL
jgi:predicted Zn-dependent protease